MDPYYEGAVNETSNPRRRKRCFLCFACYRDTPTYTYASFGRKSTQTTCPVCRNNIKTRIRYINCKRTHVSAAIFALGAMCLLPYCVPAFKAAIHECPVCNSYIGKS